MAIVTVNDIMNQFGVTWDKVEQVGNKQLFVVDAGKPLNARILVSYHTIIGIYNDGIWHITTKKYSPTTSKQITQFAYGQWDKVKRVDEDTLQAMLYRYYGKRDDSDRMLCKSVC